MGSKNGVSLKNKFCIVIDAPDGVNVFEGFDIVINPVTGDKSIFNVWNSRVTAARLFRSPLQAKEALKLVDPKGIVEARIEAYLPIKTAYNARKN